MYYNIYKLIAELILVNIFTQSTMIYVIIYAIKFKFLMKPLHATISENLINCK